MTLILQRGRLRTLPVNFIPSESIKVLLPGENISDSESLFSMQPADSIGDEETTDEHKQSQRKSSQKTPYVFNQLPNSNLLTFS